MMHASYRSDHLEADFTADAEGNDYGVPGSRFKQVKVETIKLVALTICGDDWNVLTMDAKARDAIIEQLTDDIEWEDGE